MSQRLDPGSWQSMATLAAAPVAPFLERRFFIGMALAILATVLVGFAPSFYLRSFFPGWPAPPEQIFLVHGLAFTAWIGLFVLQTALISTRRVELHRRLGPFGGALAVAMVVLGVWGALVAARRATGFIGIPVPPLQFLAVPLFDMALFGAFVTLGLLRRRDAQSHKRLMLLATISIITAAVARWPGVAPLGPLAFFGFTDLFIAALAAWDWRTRGRLHAATLWGGLAIILSQPLRLMISGTEPWLAFARWATGLLG
jgi:hypothetical protein